MNTSRGTHGPAAMTTVVALVGLAAMLAVDVALDAEEADEVIRRVVAETNRAGIATQSLRHLEAGTLSGKHRGWMDVETSVNSSGAFAWNVVREGGSERTREKVFKAVLEQEAASAREGTHDTAALSTANYEFIPDGTSADGLRFQLKPRRDDAKLVVGTLTVSADGHPILLEGRLAKSPSFWVRSITIVKRYARIEGVSLPVMIESLADVKLFGKSSFSMRYNYSAVNGRPVGHNAAQPPAFGPSRQILALHAQLHLGQ